MIYGELEKNPGRDVAGNVPGRYTGALLASRSKLRLCDKSQCAIVHSLPKGGYAAGSARL